MSSILLLTLFMFSTISISFVQADWRRFKHEHLKTTPPLKGSELNHFANYLKNEHNFERYLDQILIPRVSGTVGNEQVRKYIIDEIKALGWDVEISSHFDPGTTNGPVEFHNIIATLDENAPRRLVLACHYDSKLTPNGFLGAIDSAVPCAQMLNLAYTMRRELSEEKKKGYELTLQFIFFDGEEAFKTWTATDSIYGARNLALKWENTPYSYQGIQDNFLERIDVFVLLDLIGTRETNFVSLKKPTQLHYNRFARIEHDLRNDLNSGVKRLFTNSKKYHLGTYIEDDHKPFEQKGVPILHLISYPFPKVWHKITDNKDAINFPLVENMNKMLRVFVAEYLRITPVDQDEFYSNK